MKFARTTLALLLLGALGAPGARAQSALTRAQVKAELAEAIRNGDMVATGEPGLTLKEIHPERYRQPATQLGKTREQVKAELAEAMRTGDVPASGELGLKLNEEFPQRYPAVAVAVGKTRAEVKAETAEAIRTGDIIAAGDAGLKENQLYPARYAKARSLDRMQAQATAAAASTAAH